MNPIRATRGLKVILGTLVFFSLCFNSFANTSAIQTSLFKGHSLKKLDVAGQEMILFQAFVTSANHKVISTNDFLGVSQKGQQVSFYIDYHNAHSEFKEALSEKSYIRKQEKLNKIIKLAFAIEKVSDKRIIKVKFKK